MSILAALTDDLLIRVNSKLEHDCDRKHWRRSPLVARSFERLSLKWCMEISDLCLNLLCVKCCNLKALDISYLKLLDSLKSLKSLTRLVILWTQVTDTVLEAISISCKSLHEIGFSKCVGVMKSAIVQLVSSSYGELRTLDLKCCDLVTDAAIHALADSCKSLVCLKLESCFLVTDKGLEILSLSCLLLEEVDLTDCSGINDSGLEWLSRCSRLVTLKLGLCYTISDKGISCIASNCSDLLDLDLYRCTGIGDGSLAALANGCKRLKKLNISYCNKVNLSQCSISDVALSMVMGNLLVNLPNVTVGGFELALRACCDRIKKVKLVPELSKGCIVRRIVVE
ncbi:F-box/LRR-repeat protein 20 [Linum perenne]